MTADDLLDLFLTTLVREEGSDRRTWRRVIGPVKVYALTTHPHGNWSVEPSGSARAVAAVERVADRLHQERPIVTP